MIASMAAIALISPVCVSLTPISYGFPLLMVNNTNTALNTASVNAFDLQSASVNFPHISNTNVWDGSGSTPIVTSSYTCPTVSESEVTGQTAVQENFAQNTQFSSFAYPSVGIGASGIPGFWSF